jgi:DNA/RNA endonuclease G (NUC1)
LSKNQVSVPTHFFKVILVENPDSTIDLESYVMQNTALDPAVPLRAYQVPLDSIERAAGFLLFDNVPKNMIKRVNGSNPVLDKFQSSLAEDRVKRLATRKG